MFYICEIQSLCPLPIAHIHNPLIRTPQSSPSSERHHGWFMTAKQCERLFLGDESMWTSHLSSPSTSTAASIAAGSSLRLRNPLSNQPFSNLVFDLSKQLHLMPTWQIWTKNFYTVCFHAVCMCVWEYTWVCVCVCVCGEASWSGTAQRMWRSEGR